jgi:hypothetical protein
MVKMPTAATAERETLGMEELTEGVTLSQTGKSINIPGGRQQFLLHQYRAEDKSEESITGYYKAEMMDIGMDCNWEGRGRVFEL